MKHIFLALLLLLAFSADVMSETKECRIPVSFCIRFEFDTSFVDIKRKMHEDARHQKDVLYQFEKYLNTRALTTDICNVSFVYAVNFVCYNDSLKVRVDLSYKYDATDSLLYSALLDKCYKNKEHTELYLDAVHDLFNVKNPQLERITDDIRATILEFQERNLYTWLNMAKQQLDNYDHKMTMFHLVQYSICAKTYNQVENSMLAVYRDYMQQKSSRIFEEAEFVADNDTSKVGARYVISLLNGESFSTLKQKKADRILAKIAKRHPSLDVKATEDYFSVPELKAVAISRMYVMVIDYSRSNAFAANIPKDSYHPNYGRLHRSNMVDSYYDYYYNYCHYFDFYFW